MKEMVVEKWSTLKEVQEYLGVGRETILQWISKRNMPAYKVGRLWKFKLTEDDDWRRSGGAADGQKDEKEDKADRDRCIGQSILYDYSGVLGAQCERKKWIHGQSGA